MSTLTDALLRDFAVIVSEEDNLAVVKTTVPSGTRSNLNGQLIEVTGEVTPGSRFAIRDIPAGEFVQQYGQPIGTARVEAVVGYAETVKERGLNLMQGPGYDQESTPGLVAAGANVVVFTTGRGTTIGNAISPVVKLASNTPTFERLSRNIDVNAGTVIDGTETIPEVGERLFAHLLQVASGEVPAKAELHKHREFFQVWAEQAIAL